MHHPLSEDYKEQILEQTLLVQTDAFYEETPEARRELSDQLVAAQYDYDLQALDNFINPIPTGFLNGCYLLGGAFWARII